MSKPVLSKSKSQQQRVTYFKKDFKLLIHNITLQQEIRSTFYTTQCANYTSIPNATFKITINQTVDITTIDVTTNQQQKADLQVTLDLSHFAKGIKNDLAIVKFMINKEKILAPSSVNFYTQPLANRKGAIQYKFIGQKTTEIYQDQVQKFNLRRDQVIKIQAQLAENPQLKRLVQILDSKDEIIKTLQRKIASLIEQTRKLSHSLQRQQSQQKKRLKQGLNLNLNINATNNFHMKKINDKLTEQNTYLHKRIETLQQQVEQMQKKMMEVKLENNILQIQLGKRDIFDAPIVNVSPSKSTIGEQYSKRDALRRITEHEFDQELQRRSKMADSLFLNNNSSSNPVVGTSGGGGEEAVMKPRTSRRPNNTMVMDKSAGTLLMNPNISPARVLKQRSKTLIDPQFIAIQQQFEQSRLYDQEQVMMELKELKSLRESLQKRNLQSIRQQDGTLRYPKLQAAIKSSSRMIQRLNDEKMLLQQKLRRRDQQLQYLRKQLQRSKMNFKNFQKQLRQRSSNAKDQFDQRMAAIKLQTQMKMTQMRKQNRFSDYEVVMQQEKRQIEMEKMRYENESLREKYEQAMSQLKALHMEKSQQMNKFRTTQTAINKQKQMYKSKFYQMQDSFTKQQQQLSVTKQKAKQYSAHLIRIEQLQHKQQQLTKKLEANQKANNQLIRKCKRYQDKFAQMQPKWLIYRQMENEFDIMKRKIVNLQKINQRFQSRMQEMKKFALKLQNAYYQKKSKNQSDKQFDQHYQKQIQERLQMTYKKLRLYQREFYQQQQHELNQSKKQLIDFYYKKIVEENQRIDDALNYSQQQKQMFKNQKEHQINIIKESKVEQIDKQIKKYQILLNKLLNTEEYMPKGLNEKVSFLQEKMRKFEAGEFGAGTLSQSSQCQMKNTIDRLNDQVKDRESQINQLKKTVGKMSDGSNLLKVSNIQATFANQRKSMIQQMAKSREIFSRSFEDLKKANAQLLKQKSALQIQLQNYKFREQKLVLKNTQRQRQLQRVSKKSTDDFKRKISDLQKQIQKKSDESLKHKLQKQQFKQNMNNLIGELNATATLLEKRQQDNLNLQAENEQLKTRIQQYEEAQKSLIQQVTKIKSQAQFNQKQFKALLQDRNQNFLKIEKIKNVEIQKLRKTIQELQIKVQTQITQVLHTKRELQKLQQQYNSVESQLQQTRVSYNIVNQNYQKVQQDSVLKIHQLEQTNQLLQRNLIQIAEQLKNTEMQLHENQIINDSLNKQLLAHSAIKQDITLQQTQWLNKQKKYTLIIQEQTQKLSELFTKYNTILEQVQSVQKQNHSLQLKLIQQQNNMQQSKEKLNKKYDQINAIKGEKFQHQMLIKQLNADLQDLEHQKLQLEQKCLQLQEEISQLQEELQQRDGGLGKTRLDGKGKVETGGNLGKSRLQGGNMAKSKAPPKLRPPPKTNLLTSSYLTHQDNLQASKISKNNSRVLFNQPISNNELQKSNRKLLQQNRGNIYIDETVSLRGTQIRHDLEFHTARNFVTKQLNPADALEVQEMGPNRLRVWTVNEKQEDMIVSQQHKKLQSKKSMDASQINVDLYEQSQQQSEQDPNLDSQMSMRQQQHFNKLQQNNIINNANDSSQMIDQQSSSKYPLQQQCQSLTSNAIIEQYLKQIQQLKKQNQKLFDEKEQLVLENVQLKEKLRIVNGSLQGAQRINLLNSALGLTGGLLAKQLGQRSSTESNKQNPGIPVLSIPSQKSMASPVLGSKQTSKIQQPKVQQKQPVTSLKSKKSLNDNPSRSPRTSSRDININFARSSVQRPKSSRRQSLQNNNLDLQKLRELQLLVDQLQEQNKQLKLALQQQHGNNQKLMEQLVIMQEQQQKLSNIIRQKEQQSQQLTEYYESIKHQLQLKIEQLVQQQISKQTQQLKLVKTFQAKNQQIFILNNKIEQLQKVLIKLNSEIKQLQSQKTKSYHQYRKYQEQSQLEILKLKESLTYNNQLYKKKEKQLQLLAEQYFQLQTQHQLSQKSIHTYQSTINSNLKQISALEKDYATLLEQAKKHQQQRKSHNQKIHQLQTDIIGHEHTVQAINKATSMSIQKYQIKLNSSQQQKSLLKQKLSQKQSIIQSLKHQIALYNQQTEELKLLNSQLSLQLQRTQKQLKEIMKSYQLQFGNLKLDLKSNQQAVQKYKHLIKQKDEQLSRLGRLFRKCQEQVREARESQHQVKQSYQKYKSSKSQQINSLMGQIQISHNQLQKCKIFIDKLQQQFTNKQSNFSQRIQLLQQTKVSYKQKLLKYQTVLEELQSQLNIMSQRPAKQIFDELQFENDLYKNRIQQLEQMIAEFGPLTKSRKIIKQSDDNMQLEFKKYKLQKQRQLDDLSNQIDKYSGKINQLEQSNFILKKQIQKVNLQLKQIIDKNQQLQEQNYDLKQDISQLRQEVEFYKGKRIQNLSKLLNQTM